MPIVQIQARQGEQYLSAPTTLNNADTVLTEWYKDAWQSEMFVYPSGFVGDITPQGWEMHSFMLQVDDSGEQAQMLAVGKMQTDEEMAEAIQQLRAATPEQARVIGSVATVSEHNKSVFMAVRLNNRSMAIGGIVLHARPSKLRSLREMFQATDVAADARFKTNEAEERLSGTESQSS